MSSSFTNTGVSEASIHRLFLDLKERLDEARPVYSLRFDIIYEKYIQFYRGTYSVFIRGNDTTKVSHSLEALPRIDCLFFAERPAIKFFKETDLIHTAETMYRIRELFGNNAIITCHNGRELWKVVDNQIGYMTNFKLRHYDE